MTVARLAGRWPGFHRAQGLLLSVSQMWFFAGQGARGKAVIRVQAVAMACAQGQLAGIFSRRRRPPRTSFPAACRIRPVNRTSGVGSLVRGTGRLRRF